MSCAKQLSPLTMQTRDNDHKAVLEAEVASWLTELSVGSGQKRLCLTLLRKHAQGCTPRILSARLGALLHCVMGNKKSQRLVARAGLTSQSSCPYYRGLRCVLQESNVCMFSAGDRSSGMQGCLPDT